METLFSDRVLKLKETFSSPNKEILYAEIMDWGKRLPAFDPQDRTEANRVTGCQSLMYLKSEESGGYLRFRADSDALISKGLASILIYLYSDLEPLILLQNPPTFLEELGLLSSLTPGRASGFASLYLKMKKHALDALVKQHSDRSC